MLALRRSQKVDQLCSKAELHRRYSTRATPACANAYIFAKDPLCIGRNQLQSRIPRVVRQMEQCRVVIW